MWIIHSGPVFWVHNSLLFLKESCYFLWSTCFTAEAEWWIKRDNFCQICVLENPGPTMRHTVGYWIGPASAERLIPLGIYCRNCQAFSHKASSAVECHASLSITSLLSCITEHKITTSCQSVIFFFYQTLICIMSGSIISKEKIFSPNENANLLNEKDVLKVSSLEFT